MCPPQTRQRPAAYGRGTPPGVGGDGADGLGRGLVGSWADPVGEEEKVFLKHYFPDNENNKTKINKNIISAYNISKFSEKDFLQVEHFYNAK